MYRYLRGNKSLRGHRFLDGYTFLKGALIFMSLLMVWHLIVIIVSVPRFILPSPLLVARAFIDNSALLMHHSLVTLTEVILGLVIGIILGIVTALQLDMSRLARAMLKPFLIFSQAIPVFALAPVLTLWLGYGMISKITMAVLIIYFPVTSAFHDGLSRTPKGYLDLAKVMSGEGGNGSGKGGKNFSHWRCLYFIKIPAAIPSLMSGIKLAAVYAPIGAVIGEWVGSSQGLGYLMLLANGRVKTDLMFASLFTLGFMSMVLYAFITFLITRYGTRFQA